ncbi:hypothetical protein K652_09174 [Pseudomonas aeruginosa VRFPA02]|nr:hypothetical protein K652_09174 [Pseudomonas aeruginosa VRFPA02]
MHQLRIRESLFDVETLPPSRMSDHDIWSISSGFQGEQQAQHLLSMQHRVLEATHVMVGIRPCLSARSVAQHANAGQSWGGIAADRQDIRTYFPLEM